MSVQDTLNDRAKTHGNYREQAVISQEIKHSMGLTELPDYQREALEVIASKVARIVCGDNNFVDHWHDIAGYASLVERELRGG